MESRRKNSVKVRISTAAGGSNSEVLAKRRSKKRKRYSPDPSDHTASGSQQVKKPKPKKVSHATSRDF